MTYYSYKEKQYIKDLGIKVLVLSSAIVTFLLVAGLMYKDYEAGKDLTEYWLSLGIIAVVEIGVYLLIFKMGMNLEGGSEGIRFSYPPFLIKPKEISWSMIETWQIRQIKPFKEFGGWGYKFSFKGKKTGLVLKEGDGIEILLKSGKTWVITINNAEMLRSLLRKHIPEKEVKSE